MVKDQKLVYRLKIEVERRERKREREESVSVLRAATGNPSVQDETSLEKRFEENKEQLCLVQFERISRDVERREKLLPIDVALYIVCS